MTRSAETGSELHVKAVLENSAGSKISIDVLTAPLASFDCSTVQEAIRELVRAHSETPKSCEFVLWNRLAPDVIDDIVACVRDLGCEVLAEHQDHVRFRLLIH
jgi:hypothetical protein